MRNQVEQSEERFAGVNLVERQLMLLIHGLHECVEFLIPLPIATEVISGFNGKLWCEIVCELFIHQEILEVTQHIVAQKIAAFEC